MEILNPTTIRISNNNNAKYLAFGDDSQYKNTLVYAFAILKRYDFRRAEKKIRKIRTKFKIPANVPIHCRILFHRHQREKNDLGHLTDHDARSLVRLVIKEMNKIPVILRYSYMALNNLTFDNKITLEHISDGSTLDLPLKPDPKGFLGLLMQTCFAVSPDGKQGPPASECQIYTSEDSTKIKFIGEKRTRADKLYSGFSDIGAPKNTVFHIEPIVLKNSDIYMLSVADILAYICSHAIEKDCDNPFFQEQLTRVKYWSSAKFV